MVPQAPVDTAGFSVGIDHALNLVSTIYGGTSEIQREFIAKTPGL